MGQQNLVDDAFIKKMVVMILINYIISASKDDFIKNFR